MTKGDVDKLFQLLQIYFPNSSKLKNEQIKSAWLLILEPYPREEVRRALVEQLRESKFLPDPQSIAVRCKLPKEPETAYSVEAEKPLYGKDLVSWKWQQELIRKNEVRKTRIREAGLPADLYEARAAGLNSMEWDEMLERAGFGIETIL